MRAAIPAKAGICVPLYLHPHNNQAVYVSNISIGWVGEIHPDILDKLEIEQRVFAFDIDVSRLLETESTKDLFKSISRYPVISRDIAVLMPRETEVGKLIEIISNNKPSILIHFDLFDVYLGEQIPKDKKSVAINLNFGSSDKTLKDEEVDQALNKLIASIQKSDTFKIRE